MGPIGGFWHSPTPTPHLRVPLPSLVPPGRRKQSLRVNGRGSSSLGTPSLPQAHSAGDRGLWASGHFVQGIPHPKSFSTPRLSPWGSLPIAGGVWERLMVAGGDSRGLPGGGSQPPPTAAPVGSRGAGAGGGRWISTPGWGPSPVGFAKLPVSHGRRAGEAAGAWGAGGAAGAPGGRGCGRRQPRDGLQRAAGGSALGSAASPSPSRSSASPGVQPPRGVFSSWGLPAWGRSRDGNDGFPAWLGRGRTGVTLWMLCPRRG